MKRNHITQRNIRSRFPLQVLAACAQRLCAAGFPLQSGLVCQLYSSVPTASIPKIGSSGIMITFILIMFLLTGCASSSKIANRQPDERGFLVKVGDTAPNFNMQFTDGTKAALKDYKGRPVMLQFTASWCGVCIKEMPHIEKEIWQEWKEEGLVVIGIDRDEPLEKAELLIEKTGVTYPIALDPGAEIYHKYAGKKTGVTRNVIINKNGKIVFLTRLFKQAEFDAMKEKIASLL